MFASHSIKLNLFDFSLRKSKLLHQALRRLCLVDEVGAEKGHNLIEKSQHLQLYDTFSKVKKHLSIDGEPISLVNTRTFGDKFLRLYCCGPTVYDDCHLGHAITYIRCDLLRRALKNYAGIRVLMAMGITDIDDKILNKAKEMNESDYRVITKKYTASFLNDMQALRVLSADCYLRVSDHIDDIVQFIKQLQASQLAYISELGDVNFDSKQFSVKFGIEKLWVQEELVTDKSVGKKSPKDFALWKKAKPGEPCWHYEAPDGTRIAGRPGWHVECSAMASRVFGDSIDLHFGGQDLIFPHHYSEAMCCHAFHKFLQESDPKNIYSWCKIWMHSGHLIFKTEKMSKSLGNGIMIKEFLKKFSANVLRLLCINHYYRHDFVYDDQLMQMMTGYDKKLQDFYFELHQAIRRLSSESVIIEEDVTILDEIKEIENQIIEGIFDDLNFNYGFQAIWRFIKNFDLENHKNLCDLIILKSVFGKWFNTMGLSVRKQSVADDDNILTANEEIISNLLIKFRSIVRENAIKSLAATRMRRSGKASDSPAEGNEIGASLLFACDQLRSELNDYGIRLKDPSISMVLDKK